jgi:hypothetical protein
MVHLYALVDHPANVPDELAAAEAAGIDAVYREEPEAPTTEEAILAHARVVEELASANEAVLPARFPGRYADDAALVAAVRERAPQFRQALDRVRGRVELGVRVVRTRSGDERSAASGGDYMRRRLAEVREAEQLAAELAAAAAALAGESSHAVTADGEIVLTGAYLLPRTAADSFRASVEQLAAAHEELAYVCVGPWPPYSFALVDGSPA